MLPIGDANQGYQDLQGLGLSMDLLPWGCLPWDSNWDASTVYDDNTHPISSSLVSTTSSAAGPYECISRV